MYKNKSKDKEKKIGSKTMLQGVLMGIVLGWAMDSPSLGIALGAAFAVTSSRRAEEKEN